MTNQVIPEAAVEAAARAIYDCFPSLSDPHDEASAVPWDEAREQRRREDREQARAALEAAAPHMLAEAWDAGYMAEGSARTDNPYRTNPRNPM